MSARYNDKRESDHSNAISSLRNTVPDNTLTLINWKSVHGWQASALILCHFKTSYKQYSIGSTAYFWVAVMHVLVSAIFRHQFCVTRWRIYVLARELPDQLRCRWFDGTRRGNVTFRASLSLRRIAVLAYSLPMQEQIEQFYCADDGMPAIVHLYFNTAMMPRIIRCHYSTLILLTNDVENSPAPLRWLETSFQLIECSQSAPTRHLEQAQDKAGVDHVAFFKHFVWCVSWRIMKVKVNL